MRKKLKTTGVYLLVFLCLEDQSAAWSTLPNNKYFHEILLWKLVTVNKKNLLISHTAAYDFLPKTFQYGPTALITEQKFSRTMAGLCEKENHCLPLNPTQTWMYCIKNKNKPKPSLLLIVIWLAFKLHTLYIWNNYTASINWVLHHFNQCIFSEWKAEMSNSYHYKFFELSNLH